MKGINGVKLLLVDDEPHILQFLELEVNDTFIGKGGKASHGPRGGGFGR